MKNYIIGAIIVIVLLIVSIGGIHAFDKAAEKELVAQYDAKIKANDKTIADYDKLNKDYLSKISADSATIESQNKELILLKGQYASISQELSTAKGAIKNYTDGEAIKAFINYSKATDSKMLIQKPDTSLIVTVPSIKKIDTIFIEHQYRGLQIVNLNTTIDTQNKIILTFTDEVTNYKTTLSNKDKEMSLIKDNAELNTKKDNLTIAKLTAQRNTARWLIGGAAAVVITPTIIKLFVK